MTTRWQQDRFIRLYRALIKKWRAEIESFDFDYDFFEETTAYSEMRPYLDEETKAFFDRAFDSTVHEIPRGALRGRDLKKNLLLDSVTNIEKKWGLMD